MLPWLGLQKGEKKGEAKNNLEENRGKWMDTKLVGKAGKRKGQQSSTDRSGGALLSPYAQPSVKMIGEVSQFTKKVTSVFCILKNKNKTTTTKNKQTNKKTNTHTHRINNSVCCSMLSRKILYNNHSWSGTERNNLVDLQYVLWSRGISRKSAALIVKYSQKKKWISFVFYCFKNLSIAIILEPLARFRWGFQQNIPLLMSISIK